uniref:Uncharacterized protein n=1 Tax=Ciona intestinalis TaxID=7719 RepID=H2XX68_CIOIN
RESCFWIDHCPPKHVLKSTENYKSWGYQNTWFKQTGFNGIVVTRFSFKGFSLSMLYQVSLIIILVNSTVWTKLRVCRI